MKESEKVFPLNPKPKEASKATYAGDYGVKKSLIDTMLKSYRIVIGRDIGRRQMRGGG